MRRQYHLVQLLINLYNSRAWHMFSVKSRRIFPNVATAFTKNRVKYLNIRFVRIALSSYFIVVTNVRGPTLDEAPGGTVLRCTQKGKQPFLSSAGAFTGASMSTMSFVRAVRHQLRLNTFWAPRRCLATQNAPAAAAAKPQSTSASTNPAERELTSYRRLRNSLTHSLAPSYPQPR